MTQPTVAFGTTDTGTAQWDMNKSSAVLVTGNTSMGKTTLLQAIAEDLASKDQMHESHVINDTDYHTTLLTLRTVIEEFNHRTRQMEVLGLNTYQKLPERVKQITIIIDDFDRVLDSAQDNPDHFEEIQRNVNRIGTHGRTVGVNIVLASHRVNHETLSPDLLNNIPTRVLLGKASLEKSHILFNNDRGTLLSEGPSGRGTGYFEQRGEEGQTFHPNTPTQR